MNTWIAYLLGTFTGAVLLASLLWCKAARSLRQFDLERIHPGPDDWAGVAEQLARAIAESEAILHKQVPKSARLASGRWVH